jgi:hypothetical protein
VVGLVVLVYVVLYFVLSKASNRAVNQPSDSKEGADELN